MSQPQSASANTTEVALEMGFSQCVHALRKTLHTTPLGWMLVVMFCWELVPVRQTAFWLGIFGVIWVFCLWALNKVLREGPSIQRHRRWMIGVAGLDGLAWGLISPMLTGYDNLVDSALVTLLCGVGAVNAPVYITYIRAYFVQIGLLWLVSSLGLLHFQHQQAHIVNYVFGLSLFLGLIAYYMRSVAQRIFDGIELQLANVSLTEQLRLALQSVKLDAATDALTGQGNRRSLDELLKYQIELASTTGRPFAVLMLDIDFFKQINDTHGHIVGDDTLRAFALRVRAHLRQGDVCTRFGGEEFMVVLPGTSMEKAIEVAERVRLGVANTDLLSTPPVRVTVSIGVAVYAAGQTIQDLLNAADEAVYVAKRGGRNQVKSGHSAAI